jgi:hypothetical protein
MKQGRMRAAAAAALVVAMVGPAAAEQAPPSPARVFTMERLERFVREAELTRAAQDGQATAQRRRDSVLNGALIGAAIGGVGGSALIVASRGGSDNIPKAMWNVSLGPTIVGAVAGAIVDALR